MRFAREASRPRRRAAVRQRHPPPTLVPVSTTAVRVSWPAGYDRDDYTLTYRVLRNGATIRTTTANSNWWTLPAQGFVDTGLSPGQTYSYQVVANDPDNNTVFGSMASVTDADLVRPASAYAATVRNSVPASTGR